jgi:hypothetical protein
LEATFRRRIVVRRERDTITADLEDNFHRFGVRLSLRDGFIERADGVAHRFPWTTCADAVASLADFHGHDAARQPAGQVDVARHCTHLVDLVRLATDHVRLSLPDRNYVFEVQGGRELETATLRVDDAVKLEWRVSADTIRAPIAWAGRSLKDFARWAADELAPVPLLEALLLRRAIHISRGRFIDQDAWRTAADVGAPATCVSFRSDVAPRAIRVLGSARDFTAHPERLLHDLEKPDPRSA